jgi:hypothetical protein
MSTPQSVSPPLLIDPQGCSGVTLACGQLSNRAAYPNLNMQCHKQQLKVCSSALQPSQRAKKTLVIRAHAVNSSTKDGYKVLIVGGGSAGITTASHYARKLPGQVAVLEPSGDQQLGSASTMLVTRLVTVLSTSVYRELSLRVV